MSFSVISFELNFLLPLLLPLLPLAAAVPVDVSVGFVVMAPRTDELLDWLALSRVLKGAVAAMTALAPRKAVGRKALVSECELKKKLPPPPPPPLPPPPPPSLTLAAPGLVLR